MKQLTIDKIKPQSITAAALATTTLDTDELVNVKTATGFKLYLGDGATLGGLPLELYTAGAGIDITSGEISVDIPGLSLMAAGSVVDSDLLLMYDLSMTTHYRLAMGGLKTYLNITDYTAGAGIDITSGEISVDIPGLNLISGASIVDSDLMLVYDSSLTAHYRLTMGGLKTYIGGAAGVSFGSQYQIPFTNSGINDFDYDAAFTFTPGTTDLLTVDGLIWGKKGLRTETQILFSEWTRTTTPGSGAGSIWLNTSNQLMFIDENNDEYDLTGLAKPIGLHSTNRSAYNSDYTYINTAPGSSNPIYMPQSPPDGKILVIVNRSSEAMTVKNYNNTATITYYTFSGTATTIPAYSSVTLQYNGSSWYQIH